MREVEQKILATLNANNWREMTSVYLAALIAEELVGVKALADVRRESTGIAWKRLLTAELPTTIGTIDVREITGLTRGAIRKWLLRHVPPLPERLDRNEWQWDTQQVLAAVREAKGSGNRYSYPERQARKDRSGREGPLE